MPKVVDHEQRRETIAHIACHVIARRGFEQASVARIARAAGHTTGMVAHYFDSKHDIVAAALRLILLRTEQRLRRQAMTGDASLLTVLSESLALDSQRFVECAFWTAFWGRMPLEPRLKRLNAGVHRDYLRMYERCFTQFWPEWRRWPKGVREQVLRSTVVTINGLTTSAVTSRADWPARRQTDVLSLSLDLLRRWALRKHAARRASRMG